MVRLCECGEVVRWCEEISDCGGGFMKTHALRVSVNKACEKLTNCNFEKRSTPNLLTPTSATRRKYTLFVSLSPKCYSAP